MKRNAVFILVLTFSLLLAACSKDEKAEPAPEPEEPVAEIPELDEEGAKEILQTYEDTYTEVIENMEENDEITAYTSLEELKEDFLPIMSQDLAEEILDTYFEENEESIFYIADTEEPVWLDEEVDFSLEEKEAGLYEVEQEQEENAVVVTYTISWDEENWVVAEVQTEEIPELENNGSQDNSASNDNGTVAEDNHEEDSSADNGDASVSNGNNNTGNTDTPQEDENESHSDSQTNQSGGDHSSPSNEGQESEENTDEEEESNGNQGEGTASMNESQAEDLVRQYLNLTGSDEFYIVTDHMDENGNFVVQVYEVINLGDASHTSTYGWYIVNKDTGEIQEMQ